jgi:hypothetical protein
MYFTYIKHIYTYVNTYLYIYIYIYIYIYANHTLFAMRPCHYVHTITCTYSYLILTASTMTCRDRQECLSLSFYSFLYVLYACVCVNYAKARRASQTLRLYAILFVRTCICNVAASGLMIFLCFFQNGLSLLFLAHALCHDMMLFRLFFLAEETPNHSHTARTAQRERERERERERAEERERE